MREHPEDPGCAYTWSEFRSFFVEHGYSADYAWRQWTRSMPAGLDGEPAWLGCHCCHCQLRRQQHTEALKPAIIAFRPDTLRKKHLLLLRAFQMVAGNLPSGIKPLIWSYLRNPFELWIASFNSAKKKSKSCMVQVLSLQSGQIKTTRRFKSLPILPALTGPGKHPGERISNIVLNSTLRSIVTGEGFRILGRLAVAPPSRMFHWIATERGVHCTPMLPSDVGDDGLAILEKTAHGIKFVEDLVAVSLECGWAAIECFNEMKGAGKGKASSSRLVRVVDLESGETVDQCRFEFSFGLDARVVEGWQGLCITANRELLIVVASMDPYTWRIHVLMPKIGPQQTTRWLSQVDVCALKDLAVGDDMLAICQRKVGNDIIHLMHLCIYHGLDPRPFRSFRFASTCDVIKISLASGLLMTLLKDERSTCEFVKVWSIAEQEPTCMWSSSIVPVVAWMSSRLATAEPQLTDLQKFTKAVSES